ncbi:uncharacterized protein YjiS (DUF1127 family) [Limimaricola variabilis]|uniref:Uncharacterized protein YjiS (DUF1127 family) n=1 Tax=Limimaricola variabilis TaxID=1492771 RepID=A0ABR6HN66_9RHOB|nr:hypothetical protein [Limimaricola variabilis]MBB3711893.1 uncharacterized protein YjiS (DUF1127 family) [Limimaricola variabilis]
MSVLAPAAPATAFRPLSRLRAALGRLVADRQMLCDLALLEDADLAHLGITGGQLRQVRTICRVARIAKPLPAGPAAAPQLRPTPFGLLASAALRR